MSNHHRRQRTTSQFSATSSQSSLHGLELLRPPSVLLTRPKRDEAFGAFTTTRSASDTLRGVAHKSYRSKTLSILTSNRARQWHTLPAWDSPSDDGSGPSSPVSIHSVVPSISRTASSFFEHDDISSPASSALSLTDEYTQPVEVRAQQQQLNHILARLEKQSKLCSRSAFCATCQRPGNDYPRCGKCGERWCSRECRLNGGKRHICSNIIEI